MADTCAACGFDLTPVSVLNAVIVADLDAVTGTAVSLLFGRECGHAREVLAPRLVAHWTKEHGQEPPARGGTDPNPADYRQGAHVPEPPPEPTGPPPGPPADGEPS